VRGGVLWGPPPLSRRLGELVPELDAVLQRALAYDPDQRYGTAGELWSALAIAFAPIDPAATTEVAAALADLLAHEDEPEPIPVLEPDTDRSEIATQRDHGAVRDH
jgi:hypothetical protein